MKKYDSYKDSGVKWLGEIPEHWELKRLASYFEERREKVSDKDFEPLSVTKNGIMPQLETAAKSNDGDNRKLVKQGDFVINSRSDRKGSSGVSPLDGSVSLINIVLEPSNVQPKFCNYLLKSYSFIEEYYRVGRGIVADLWTTRFDEMKLIMLGMPPFEEQKAIAEFLDEKTAKIDQSIAVKEKEINLLKERRQILIQELVTGKKVWDGNKWTKPTKTKDSGVDWIGEIPEDWEVKKLKFCLKVRNEKVESKDSFKTYVGMENIESKTGRHIISESDVVGLANAFYKGDILFGKLRPYLTKVYLGEFDGICSTEFLVLRGEDTNYFQKLLLSDAFISLVDSSTYGAKMPRANAEYINNIQIPISPKSERILINNYLINCDQKIQKAVSLKQQEIEKLKEYKTVLIDNVVTGKIKVC